VGSTDFNSDKIVSITASSSRSDFRIRQPKNFVAGTAQVLITYELPLSILVESMLRSVDLGNDSRSAAFEVNNISQDGGLSSKMMAQSAKFAKPHPQLYFLGRRCFAQLTGDFVGHGLKKPHPAPPFARSHPPLTGGIPDHAWLG